MFEKLRQNKVVFIVVLTGAVFLFFKYICPLIAPMLIAFLFISSCYSFLEKVNRKTHIPKGFLAVGILLLLFLLFGGILWMILSKCMLQIPTWIHQADKIENQVCLFVRDCCQNVGARFGFDALHMEMAVMDNVTLFVNNLQTNVFPKLLSESWTYAGYMFKIGGFVALTVISVALLAKDYGTIVEKAKEYKELEKLMDILEQVLHYVGTFLKAQLTILIGISILSMVVLFFLKIENGLFLGALAGVLDVLPFIGTGIVLVPLALWQLINGMYGKAIGCLLLYGSCALLRECLEPKLIGKKMGIYPVAILVSIYAGLKLFGIIGILEGPLAFVIIYQTYRILK